MTLFVNVVSEMTSAVFTLECVLKLVAEGYHPERYAAIGALVLGQTKWVTNPQRGEHGRLLLPREYNIYTYYR